MAKMVFAEEIKEEHSNNEPWLILVADDEADVHMVTKMVLGDFKFEDRRIELMSTYNGEETLDLIKKHPKTAVLLLDVVMESYTAGLDVANNIRNEIDNCEVRIILRSGQAGYANVSEIIQQYDINNFLRKEQLRHQDLKDAVLIALRSYRDIQSAKEKVQKQN